MHLHSLPFVANTVHQYHSYQAPAPALPPPPPKKNSLACKHYFCAPEDSRLTSNPGCQASQGATPAQVILRFCNGTYIQGALAGQSLLADVICA